MKALHGLETEGVDVQALSQSVLKLQPIPLKSCFIYQISGMIATSVVQFCTYPYFPKPLVALVSHMYILVCDTPLEASVQAKSCVYV